MKFKKVVFFCATIILSALVLELFSFAFGKLFLDRVDVHDGPFPKGRPNFPLSLQNEVAHPYIGYVLGPRDSKHAPCTSEYGFVGRCHQSEGIPFQRESDEQYIVAVFGGSVAMSVSFLGMEALRDELKKIPALKDKKIVLLNFAFGGYKQPQQLMILNYMLALDGAFDMIINLDGFNDIVLPVTENLPDKTCLFFPRRWRWRLFREVGGPEEILRRADLIRLKKTRKTVADVFSMNLFRYSFTMQLVFRLIDGSLSAKIFQDMQKLSAGERPVRDSYAMMGPQRSYADDRTMYQDLAAFWERCSLQMHRICNANGIRYYHFLQPNQYVLGTKPIRDQERRIAINERHVYKKSAEEGYPYLSEMGKALSDAGVKFYDLTRVFSDHPEPLYVDDCCHVGNEGVAILVRAMGRNIAKDLQ
ncbi:MAG TPA: hypothetical protein PLL75_01010 [Candidatus Omnitrophota bacterium]|nr:hypothetical protein [Candidatus Omnitrophota bacterium]HPS36293.1 hypothetical protein [Candidatus Omnitrophota bacterium]